MKPTDMLILKHDFMDELAHIWNRGTHFEVLKVKNGTLECKQAYPYANENYTAIIPISHDLYEAHTRAHYILFVKQESEDVRTYSSRKRRRSYP